MTVGSWISTVAPPAHGFTTLSEASSRHNGRHVTVFRGENAAQRSLADSTIAPASICAVMGGRWVVARCTTLTRLIPTS
jgi:hypothetical protein